MGKNGLPKNWAHRHGAYYYRIPLSARHSFNGKYWYRLGKTYAEALKEFAGVLEGNADIKLMEGLIHRYIAEITPKKASSTQKNEYNQAKRLIAFFGKSAPERIKQMNVYQYLDARSKVPVSANRDIALLSSVFVKAIRWGIVDSNPCKGIEKHREKPRDRYVTDDEFTLFYDDYCNPTIQAYLRFKYITGQRQSDVLKLKLSDIGEKKIAFQNSKTNKKFTMDITAELRAAINQARKIKRKIGTMYLFAGRSGKPYTGTGFRAIWQRSMKKWKEDGHDGFTEHDIRAKTASDAEALHAKEMMQHSSQAFTDRVYRRKMNNVRPLK